MEIKYVKYDENLTKRDFGRFDYKNMSVFPLSDENEVVRMVVHMQDIIETYGCITISDVYDVIEGYYPSLHADRDDDDIKYGWIYISDVDILHAEHGITVYMRTDPILLEDY